MNPLTNMKNVLKLSEQELKRESKSSWHDMYKDSAWVFVGGLPYDLTEGDIISVFSQYGEVVNINLIRDKKTGKQKGYCFICYEDQRSTTLAVDNLNGIKILGRSLRVDHVANYKVPKDKDDMDDETKILYMEGCAPKPQIAAENVKRERTAFVSDTVANIELPERLPIRDQTKLEHGIKRVKVKKEKKKKEKKSKKSKKEKKSKKKKRSHSSSSFSEESNDCLDSNQSKKRSKAKKRRTRSR